MRSIYLRRDDERVEVDKGGWMKQGVAQLREVDQGEGLDGLAARHAHLPRPLARAN